MSAVTESIFSNDKFIIPMAEVQHIEKDLRTKYQGCITIVFKSTTYSEAEGCYNNIAYLGKDEAKDFIAAWCRYRHELEGDSIANISGDKEILPGTKDALNDLNISGE